MTHGLLKNAYPVWTRIPGTPFTLPGRPDYRERLTGMTEWAPRPMVERMGRGLEQGRSVEDLVQDEKSRGLLRHVGIGTLGGGIIGTAAGRIMGGEAASRPWKNILKSGISRSTLAKLKNIPRVGKIAPLIGAGAGLLTGAGLWKGQESERQQKAQEVARGLTAERILQRNALQQALLGSTQPTSQPLLRGVPLTSATSQVPLAVTLSNSGL